MANLRKSLNEKNPAETLFSSFKKKKFSVRFKKKFSIGPNIQDQIDQLENDEAETEDAATTAETDVSDNFVAAASDDVFKREFNKSIRLKKSNNNAKNSRSSSLGLIQEKQLVINKNPISNDSLLLNSQVTNGDGKNKKIN